MDQSIVFVPVLVHMLLVFFLFILLGIKKSAAVRAGLVDRNKTALNPKAWPDSVVKVSNNIANQFESPVLFYMLAVILYITGSVNEWVVLLTAIYVATRYLHSYFHVTSNYVPLRFKAFLAGMLILLGLTIWQVMCLLIKLIF